MGKSRNRRAYLELVGRRCCERDEHHLERRDPEAQLVRIHRPPVHLQGVLLVDRGDGGREAGQHVEERVVPFNSENKQHEGAKEREGDQTRQVSWGGGGCKKAGGKRGQEKDRSAPAIVCLLLALVC